MAEFAQRSIEEMLIEMERSRKIGLFSTEETRAIMKKRKRFEYKMQRRTKEKEVYLQYIQYESSLLQLLKLRRERKSIEVSKDEIEKPIALRIYKLFRIACFRFKSDIKLWLTHIDFARKNLDKERVSKIFTTMLQVHNKKSNLWIMAAKFEFEENESIETSRTLFQRALRFMPTNRKIWTEYFKMELLCVEVVMKRREMLGLNDESDTETNKVDDAILNCKIVEVVFNNAIKQIKDDVIDLIGQLIEIASEFKFTSSLVDKMYDKVSEYKCEEALDVLARRNLRGEREILKKCESTGQVADFMITEFEEKTNDAFEKALVDMNTEKMHQLYLEFCLERLRMNSTFLKEERFGRCQVAFNKLKSNFGASLELALEWINILISHSKLSEANQLIDEYLNSQKSNASLWKLKLKLKSDETNKTNEKSLIDLFYQSISCVKQNKQLDLWILMLKWCESNDYEDIEKVFEEGCKIMVNEIATFVRIEYLKWSLHKNNINGISKTRQIYQALRTQPPFSLPFHEKYIEIENCLPKPNDDRITRAYEDAINYFGQQEPDLWLAYLEYKQRVAKPNMDELSSIYWRAMKQLNDEFIETFSQRVCLLKLNDDVLSESSRAKSMAKFELNTEPMSVV